MCDPRPGLDSSHTWEVLTGRSRVAIVHLDRFNHRWESWDDVVPGNDLTVWLRWAGDDAPSGWGQSLGALQLETLVAGAHVEVENL